MSSEGGNLYFRVVEARDMLAADPNGYSDPYVKLKVEDKKEKSETIQKTLHPVWNFDSSFKVKNWNGDLTVEVYDEDDILSNDFLGFLKLPLADMRAQRSSGGWYRLMDKKNEKIFHGRIFVVFVADCSGHERTKEEIQSMLYYATIDVAESANKRDARRMSSVGLLNSPKSPKSIAEGESLAAARAVASLNLEKQPSHHHVHAHPMTLLSKLSVFIGSWNVGNAHPQEDLSSWLQPDHDLYNIGVQECKYEVPGSKLKKISELTLCGNHFQEILQKNLGEQYVLVKREDLMEIRNFIFVRKQVLEHIDMVRSGSEATGIAGVVGNKGGVAISLRYDDMALCFVTSHLAAHQDKTARRNDDVRDITAGLKLNMRNTDIHHSYHYAFWSGDLNYRLAFGDQGDAHSPTEEQFNAMVTKIHAPENNEQELQQLFTTDQLVDSMKNKKVFLGWQENPCHTFKPTFKVARGELLTYKNQRSPAWCDRILWRSFVSEEMQKQFQIRPIKFTSAPQVLTSDHKPVYATFEVPIFRLPLSTDFTRGPLSVRFSKVSVLGLSSYAEKNPANPLVKFYAPFLVRSVETKHKNANRIGGHSSSSNPASPASTPHANNAGTPLAASTPHAVTELSSPSVSSVSAASSTTTVDPTAPTNTDAPATPATPVTPATPSSAAAAATTTPVEHTKRNAFFSAVSSVTSSVTQRVTSLGDKVVTVGTAVASSAITSFHAQKADPNFDPSHSVFTWEGAELPLVESQVNNIDRLRVSPLILKVLNYNFESKIERLLATTKLDLTTGADGAPTNFELTLEYGGLPCGKIAGTFQLEWKGKDFTPIPREQIR